MSAPSRGNRKLDHIDLALKTRRQGTVDPGWDGVRLSSVALPLLDPGEVDLAVDFLGHQLLAPVMIAGMTGGHAATEPVNANLAIAAQECGIAMGVGSQRAALADASVVRSFKVVRDHAPDVLVLGNIGIAQLAAGTMNQANIARLIEMVEANAVAVHINLLQELVQPEGDNAVTVALPALERFIHDCPLPVVVKETGCGLDRKTAERLGNIGAAALDVGGAGGTNFVQIEGARAEQAGDRHKARLAGTFARWGVPTVTSLKQLQGIGVPVIATGGIRNGLDVAKALALGGDLVGIGRQMLAAAMQGPQETITELKTIIEELTIAMVLSESADIQSLRNAKLTGEEK